MDVTIATHNPSNAIGMIQVESITIGLDSLESWMSRGFIVIFILLLFGWLLNLMTPTMWKDEHLSTPKEKRCRQRGSNAIEQDDANAVAKAIEQDDAKAAPTRQKTPVH